MAKENTVVYYDRATLQELLPLTKEKGIFSKQKSLRTKDEILETEKKRLGVSKMTPDQSRELLSKVGEYKTNNFVIRDFGDYIIAFNMKMYLDNVNLKSELSGEESNEIVESVPQNVKLYTLGHKLILIILGEVYKQQKFKELVIPKKQMIEALGYNTEEKHIYRYISDVIFSLSYLSYQILRYKKNTKIDSNYKSLGHFLNNVTENSKEYIVDVNDKFVGCIQYLFRDKKDNKTEDFKRGYLQYPTSIIPATKNYKPSAYYLAHFLLTENGNTKLNTAEHKVVAFSIDKFIDEMKMKASRNSKRKLEFINALRQVEIIEKTVPSVGELENIKPADFGAIQLRIYVGKDVEHLNQLIKSNHLGAKRGQK